MPTQGKESLPIEGPTHQRIKIAAARVGKPMYRFIEELLECWEGRQEELKSTNPIKIPENREDNPPPVGYNQSVHQRIKVILEKGGPKLRDALLGNIDAFYELVELRRKIDAGEKQKASSRGGSALASSSKSVPQEINGSLARRKRRSGPEDRLAG